MIQVTRRGWVRVVRDRGGVAGFIVRDKEHVHAIYVQEGRRRSGLGRALLTEAKHETGALELWVVEDNGPARAFYEAQGFREVARGRGLGNDEGLADIHLAWRADPKEAT